MDFLYLQDDIQNRSDGFAFVLFDEDGVRVQNVRLNGVSFASLKQIEFVALNKLVSCNDRQKGYHIVISYHNNPVGRYVREIFYIIETTKKGIIKRKTCERSDGFVFSTNHSDKLNVIRYYHNDHPISKERIYFYNVSDPSRTKKDII